MLTYTTCADCGNRLQVTDGDTVHYGCTPHISTAEYWTQQWLLAEIAGDHAEADRLAEMIDEIDSAPPRLCAAAGLYASWSWPVFPLLPKGVRSHRGVISDGKHPATRHGFKDATTNADRIHAWWTRHPTHNIGIATGVAFDVIDIDVPKDRQPVAGAIAYAALLDEVDPATGRGLLPDCHGEVATASGGLHLYIEAVAGRGNKAGIYPGIDYRGLGGYVVAPPSTLGTRGSSWSWIVKPSPSITGPARG